ncbi:DUF3010 family protein [Sphingomonas sp. IC-11]|uniref:DUF3010 family protein n=1 Tax=Sphingomonas sp. IC-11 TaxID=2898528 RepID=UPI001E28AF84|nr:DUF3010 family protein [Sphingomonas sp. IC-11]
MDIKSKTANLVLVSRDDDVNVHVKSTTKKLELNDDRDTGALVTLKAAIEAFALKHNVEEFVIKSRQSSGQMAASGVTFKIETLFQLSGTSVEFVSPQTLLKFSKTNEGGVPSSLAKYQEEAFRAAAWRISGK